jgi:uncharacterized protein DUF3943
MPVARIQAVQEQRKSFRTKTLRLHPLENRIFEQACAALNDMERTQLMQEAVIHEAARLGVRWTVEPAPPLKSSWPYMPQRGDEPTEVRVSITVSLPVAEIITRAAEHVHASEPMFIIGATLAHIGRLKACFKGIPPIHPRRPATSARRSTTSSSRRSTSIRRGPNAADPDRANDSLPDDLVHGHSRTPVGSSGAPPWSILPAPCRACCDAAVLLLALVIAAAPPTAEDSWRVPIAHAGAVVLALRVSASLAWPQAYDPTRFSDEARNLKLAFTLPPDFRPRLGLLRSDGDPVAINTLGHGAFGSEIYLRARQCGHGALPALALTAITSTTWEYLIEGPYKRPSAIDLVWTPLVGGLVFGEARFRLYRWTDSKLLHVLLDPFGSLERSAGAGC